ncbi:MAG: GEVED domain-containing protein [Bacteroidota bacterium]
MKKQFLIKISLLIAFCLTVGINKSNAQVSGYTFTSSSGTFAYIAGGTVLIDGTSSMDSWVSSAITIPAFTFNCVSYTTAYVTSNGQLTLGGSAPSSSTYTGISSTIGSGIAICPFSADLDRRRTNANSEIRWQTVGNEVIFQWKQVCRYLQTEEFSFQIRLNTVTGAVVFIYGNVSGTPSTSTSYQPQVGIRTSATDYNNRMVGTGAETWAASLAGTSNSDVCRYTNTAPAKFFSTNQQYTWTPSPACSGIPLAGTASGPGSICSGESMTINLSGYTSGCGISYQWQTSPTGGAPWTNVGTSTTTYVTTQTATTYYRCITTCANGGGTNTSNVATVTMNPPLSCYCVNTNTVNTTYFINNFSTTAGTTNITNNGSGFSANGYGNFTAMSASAMQGNSINFSITESGGTMGFGIWVDWNQDGDFADGGEEMYMPGVYQVTGTGSFTVPLTATPGNTRMRVVGNELSTTPTACTGTSYTECEDYTFNVIALPACAAAPTPGTATSSIANFCNDGTPTLSLSGWSSVSGLSFQWQASPTIGPYTWSDIAGGTTTTFTAPQISSTTYYRCVVRCIATGNTSYSNILTVSNLAQSITGTNSPVNVACNTAAVLTATATGGTISWYAAATGGTALATGSPYSPVVTANTTFYVTAGTGGSTTNVGQVAWTPADGYFGTSNWGIRFNAISAFTLVSVKVYPQTPGSTLSVSLQDNTGTTISGPYTFTAGPAGVAQTLTMNISVPIGNDYRLVSNNSSGLGRGSTGVAFPYTAAGICSLTASEWGGTTTGTYYFFYDWVVSTGCESSPRVPVNVFVTSGVTPPVCSAYTSPANGLGTVCPVATMINWAASTTACRAATGYKLYFGTDAAATNIINGVNIGNVLSYNLGTLTGATTYYWKIVPTNSAGDATGCPIWSFTTVANPGLVCPGLLGTGVTMVGALPYASGAGTTAGAVDDLTSANISTCGSTSYTTGEDKVWVFTPTLSGNITITLTSTGTYTGLSLFDGCPLSAATCGAAPGSCIAYAQSSTGDKTLTACVIAGITYYLILDSYSAPLNNPYSNLTISVPSGVLAPVNDLPCDAQVVLVGDLTAGDNSCSSGTGDPTVPGCWTTGLANTVWFSFQAPASGQVRIKTIAGTLNRTQMALYQAPSGCPTTNPIWGAVVSCNNDAPACGSSSYYNSEITATGLTPGAWYYVVVDGENEYIGTFQILVMDNTVAMPVAPGQDCSSPVPVCATQFAVGNPGYQAYGNYCDFGTGYCLASGERSTVWYTININANGNLMFTIEPNDVVPAIGTAGLVTNDGTDYDWAIWKITGAGAVTCAQIAAGSATPLACNYSSIGITGLYTGGNTPASNPYTGPHTFSAGAYDGAYEPPLAVLNTEVYVLVVSNFSNSSSGFTINFANGSTAGINTGINDPLVWTGGANTTNWFDPLNWGNCAVIPNKTRSAIIPPASMWQPVINAVGAEVENLTINSGASLGINAGFGLYVYGNITQNGSFNAAATSTVTFKADAVSSNTPQILDGSFLTPNDFGNFVVDRTAPFTGSVQINSPIDVAGNFTTSNASSLFNQSGNIVNVAGNLTLFNTTLTTGTGVNARFRMYGGNAQNINTGMSNPFVHFEMDKTANSATLTNHLQIKNELNLTWGIINTAAFYVIVEATDVNYNIINSNRYSYINGNLRRNYNSAYGATYNWNFPLGTATDFRLAEIRTALTGPAYFDSYYTTAYTNTGAMDPAKAFDAGVGPYNAVSGIWYIQPNLAAAGNYSIRLYINGGIAAANPFGLIDNLFGPLKRPIASTLAFDWTALSGAIPASGTVGRTLAGGYAERTGWAGFSHFAIGSTNVPLSVELISFNANCNGTKNKVSWATATETNCDYFLVERSKDGVTFETVTKVNGNGNSNNYNYYEVSDDSPFAGISYYRLKQFDFNGTFENSSVVSVKCGERNPFEIITVQTSTENNNVNIVFNGNEGETYSATLFDVVGKALGTGKKNAEISGANLITINAESIVPGVYMLILEGENEILTRKIHIE